MLDIMEQYGPVQRCHHSPQDKVDKEEYVTSADFWKDVDTVFANAERRARDKGALATGI